VPAAPALRRWHCGVGLQPRALRLRTHTVRVCTLAFGLESILLRCHARRISGSFFLLGALTLLIREQPLLLGLLLRLQTLLLRLHALLIRLLPLLLGEETLPLRLDGAAVPPRAPDRVRRSRAAVLPRAPAPGRSVPAAVSAMIRASSAVCAALSLPAS
jgi:hypothetical protein